MERRRRHHQLPDLRPEKGAHDDEHDCVCGTRLRYLFDRPPGGAGAEAASLVQCPACGWVETIPGRLAAVHFKRSNGRWKESTRISATAPPEAGLFEN